MSDQKSSQDYRPADEDAPEEDTPAELSKRYFELAAHGIALGRSDGALLQCNAALRGLLGCDADEVGPGRLTDLVGVADRSRLEDALAALDREPSRPRWVAMALRRRQGAPLPVTCQLQRHDAMAGAQHLVSLTLLPDTSVTAIRADTDLPERLIDHVPVSIIATDLDGIILFWNHGAERLYGYSADEALGRPVTLIVPSQDEAEEQERIRAARQEGYWSGEYYQRRRDGSRFFARTHMALVLDASGVPVAVVGVDEDITDKRRAEDALRESESRYRELTERISEVFWSSDLRQPEMFYISPAYESIWGRSRQALYQNPRSFLEAVHPEDRGRVERALKEQSSGLETDTEYRIVRADGSVRWIRDRGFPVKDAAGNVVRVVGIAEDRTQQKESQQEQERLRAQVQYAQKLEGLGLLAGGIAHDFNNLLTPILGYACLASAQIDEDSPLREYLEHIETGVNQVAELTKLMLAYSGRARLSSEPTDLNALIRRLLPLVKAGLSKDIVLRTGLGDSLPFVSVDPGQMQQVIVNLITNAAEAMPGGGRVDVVTGMMMADRELLASTHVDDRLAEGEYVFLAVSDGGVGMDERTIQKIFDPFFTTKFTGRGLGLAAALGIVRSHAGAIQIDSRPGQGTTMRLLMPASGAPGDAPAADGLDDEFIAGGTVLVIDDEPAVRGIVSAMLERIGFRVLEAESGSVGLQLLEARGREIRAVVLDQTMPQMDGMETLRRIRSRGIGVPVILSSGFSAEEFEVPLSTDPACEFVQKPYTSRALIAPLQRLLKRRA